MQHQKDPWQNHDRDDAEYRLHKNARVLIAFGDFILGTVMFVWQHYTRADRKKRPSDD